LSAAESATLAACHHASDDTVAPIRIRGMPTAADVVSQRRSTATIVGDACAALRTTNRLSTAVPITRHKTSVQGRSLQLGVIIGGPV